ncbi:MAG: NAD(P)/FAD-dependent oxidoreductase [Polyangiaceae bacterium]|nr:NAD(P)/FAD-dependent oxidoreductase [Polyangiaceae bacterium]
MRRLRPPPPATGYARIRGDLEPQSVDVVVVGAGLIGLACAAPLAASGLRVVLVEQHASAGTETSSRNSGVIHAGLYYPPGSLKAECCVEGAHALYELCSRHGVSYRRTGKLIVATTSDEERVLTELLERGQLCGAQGIELLGGAELRRREPRVRATAALWSPNTGIIDPHELVRFYQNQCAEAGVTLAFRSQVTALQSTPTGWLVDVRSGDETLQLRSRYLINAAGLQGQQLAEAAGLDTRALGYELHYCRGEYFSLAPSLGALTRHLVYPVPQTAGLGIHVTFDLGGRYTAGPDANYVNAIDYRIDETARSAFARSLARYLPEITEAHLTPDYVGIRPKLQGPDDEFRDFVIREESKQGAPGFVNLLGIESPGLTASPSIAQRVTQLVVSGAV